MSIYSELQGVATAILKEFNQGSVSFIKITPSTSGTPDNPGAPTETTYALQGAVVKGVSHKLLKDSHIAATDLEVICNVVADVIPAETDFVLIDNVRYKIVHIPRLPGAGTEVVWNFVVRNGS